VPIARAAHMRRNESNLGAPAIHEKEVEARKGTVALNITPAPSGGEPTAAREAFEYKNQSLAARNWGAIPASRQPVRRVTAEEAKDTFLHGLLDTPLARDRRMPLDLFVSLAIHVTVVAAVILVPLAFTQVIDFSKMSATYLTMPRPPAAPAPRPPALSEKRTFHAIKLLALTMPTVIPKKVVQSNDEAAPDVSAAGVEGGVAGGETGGVLGGILGGVQNVPAPPPAAPKKAIYRVGGDVKPPRELVRVEPNYSPIARTARVEGTVEIDAVIDERGDVVQARAVSGPGLLIPSALKAVMQLEVRADVSGRHAGLDPNEGGSAFSPHVRASCQGPSGSRSRHPRAGTTAVLLRLSTTTKLVMSNLIPQHARPLAKPVSS
jgi:protein TonB